MRRRPWRSCQIDSRRIVAPGCPALLAVSNRSGLIRTRWRRYTLLYRNRRASETGRARLRREKSLDRGKRLLYPLIIVQFCVPTTAGPRKPAPCPRVDRCPASPHPTAYASPADPADAKRAPTLASLRAEIDRIDKELVALAQPAVGDRAPDRPGQAEAGAGGLVGGARGRGPRAGAGRPATGPLPDRDPAADLPRADERQPVAAADVAGRLPRARSTATATWPSVAKFGEAVEHVPVGSIAAVFEEVNRRHVQFGIVPLENSTDGRIADTLDMFVRLPGLKIRAEVRLRVHHCLLGRCEWGQVQRIYSKAQALSQCRHWLGKNLPQARIDRRRLDRRGGRARPARGVRRRDRQPRRGRRLPAQRPGGEHRGPAAQRHPVRRHRRARRGARPAATRRP